MPLAGDRCAKRENPLLWIGLGKETRVDRPSCAGATKREFCRCTGYKWLQRYQQQGWAGLEVPLSRATTLSPSELHAAIEQADSGRSAETTKHTELRARSDLASFAAASGRWIAFAKITTKRSDRKRGCSCGRPASVIRARGGSKPFANKHGGAGVSGGDRRCGAMLDGRIRWLGVNECYVGKGLNGDIGWGWRQSDEGLWRVWFLLLTSWACSTSGEAVYCGRASGPAAGHSYRGWVA